MLAKLAVDSLEPIMVAMQHDKVVIERSQWEAVMKGTRFRSWELRTDLKLSGNQLKCFIRTKCYPLGDPIDFFFWILRLLCGSGTFFFF